MDQQTDAFNFNAFEDIDAVDVPIKNPITGEATPMTIRLQGPEHEARRKRAFVKQRRMRAEWAKTQKMPVVDPQQEFDDETDELVASTIGWTGAATEFSPAAARALYADPKRRWLRAQVATALAERERFLATSAAA